ncbi:MAG: acyl-CoA dehydrogenase family protein [Phycisphaerales bacterium]|nr:acyl-CoA dehydrogenase family protein [Phycisphaerales bacterium]
MSAQAPAAAVTPEATDYYNVRGLMSEDERQIQDAVARFVDEKVLPVIPQAFEDHRFPSELVSEIAGMGLLGCNIDGYDCAGLNNVCYGLICQELERGDSGVRSFVSVQGSLCMYPILTFGSEEQRQKWLPPMAAGEVIGCFGLTEPDGGSDPGTMKTHAKKDGGDWVLNGAKMWITNGTVADIAIVWAMTDDGVRGFIVEKEMPGYTTRDILRKFSLRASVTSELFFDNVRVPEANMLLNVRGLKGPLSCLTQARYGIAWGAIGAAIACYKEALDYSKVRIVFKRPIAHTQTIQRRLADMCRRITTAQLLALQLGRLKDEGTMHHSQVSMAKWNNVRMALDIARDARDILGAGGISIECSPIRHMLNMESVITYEGTETIHELIVGRELCGKEAF